MRKKLLSIVSAAAVAVFAFAGLTSCGDDHYETYVQGGDASMYTDYFTVTGGAAIVADRCGDWTYSSLNNRWEKGFVYDNIDTYMMGNGVVAAEVYIDEPGGLETRNNLPYVETVADGHGGYITHTMGFQISRTSEGQGQIMFYAHTSDPSVPPVLTNTKYDYKVTLFFEE